MVGARPGVYVHVDKRMKYRSRSKMNEAEWGESKEPLCRGPRQDDPKAAMGDAVRSEGDINSRMDSC